jgi:hypothetical protein
MPASIKITCIVLALAALLVGCGGSDSEPLTKAQFIKRADAICTQVDTRQTAGVSAFTKTLTKPPTKAEQSKLVLDVGLPPIAMAIEEIESLEGPQADQRAVDAITAGWNKALAVAEGKPEVVLSGINSPFIKADALAASYGFRVCKEIL